MIDQDVKNILFFVVGMALVCVFAFVVLVWATRPTPMQYCIKASYEWIDGDCVK
jgi:hypothetical protein